MHNIYIYLVQYDRTCTNTESFSSIWCEFMRKCNVDSVDSVHFTTKIKISNLKTRITLPMWMKIVNFVGEHSINFPLETALIDIAMTDDCIEIINPVVNCWSVGKRTLQAESHGRIAHLVLVNFYLNISAFSISNMCTYIWTNMCTISTRVPRISYIRTWCPRSNIKVCFMNYETIIANALVPNKL